MFVLDKPVQPNHLFVSKAEAYQSETVDPGASIKKLFAAVFHFLS